MTLSTFVMAVWLGNAFVSDDRYAVQPFGAQMRPVAVRLVKRIEKTFGISVTVAPNRPLPREAYYSPRSRYRAEILLRDLEKVKGFEHVIGITDRDISTTNGKIHDWGVFGLGSMPGKACVVSTFRLSRRLGKVSAEERLNRVVLHEIGHTFGLAHCPDKDCLMADAEGSVKSVDRASRFCRDCQRRLGGQRAGR